MRLTVRNYLLSGAVAAIVAAVFANAYHALYLVTTGRTFTQLNFGSITFAAVVLPLLAALFYYIMARFTDNAAAIFITVGVTLLFFSVTVTMFAPRAPGFATASLPLQVIVALSSLIIMPVMVRPNEQTPKISSTKNPAPPKIPLDRDTPHQVPSRAHYPPETGIPY